MENTNLVILISKWRRPLTREHPSLLAVANCLIGFGVTSLARIFALGFNIFLERQLHLQDDNLDSLIFFENLD